MRVDLKSMLLGAGIVLALFIVIGQTTKPSQSIGRYQLIRPQSAGDYFNTPILLDTKSGECYTWKHLLTPKGDTVEGWDPMIWADTSLYRLFLELHYR